MTEKKEQFTVWNATMCASNNTYFCDIPKERKKFNEILWHFMSNTGGSNRTYRHSIETDSKYKILVVVLSWRIRFVCLSVERDRGATSEKSFHFCEFIIFYCTKAKKKEYFYTAITPQDKPVGAKSSVVYSNSKLISYPHEKANPMEPNSEINGKITWNPKVQ